MDDDETAACIAIARPVATRIIQVREPGQMAAMAAGLAAATTEYVAFTDDDAVPRPDWIERLMILVSSPGVGAAGGRDAIGGANSGWITGESKVGKLSQWGRLTGNHHLGIGPAREVDVLKGVNCLYRREAVAIPRNLKGDGAQVHNEVGIGLRAKHHGWQLIYDPAAVVDHYPAPRHGSDTRDRPAASAIRDAAYNLTFVVGSFGFERAAQRAVYALVIGDRAQPGVLRAAAALPSRDGREVLRRLVPAVMGNIEAVYDLLRGQRLQFFESG